MLPFSNEVIFLLTLVSTAVCIVLWINKQFSNLRSFVYDKVDGLEETILAKLEYHERHDDRRFGDLSNDLWEIRVRNAAIDGTRLKTKLDQFEEKVNSSV